MSACALWCAGTTLVVIGTVIAAPDRVLLRNGDVIEGRISEIDAGGVSIRRTLERNGGSATGDGASRAIEATDRLAWDRVAQIESDDGGQPSADPETAAWLERGERLWRARARLARGDTALAEQALGPAWVFEPTAGPTGLVAALIELQVALGREDHPRAWRAWLEVARARQSGAREAALETWLECSSSGTLIQRPLVDELTGLCPALPPFAADASEQTRMLAVLDDFDARGDAELALLRDAIAAVVAPSREPPPVPEAGSARPSGATGKSSEERSDESDANSDRRRTRDFLRALRALRRGDAAERDQARESVVAQRRRLPEWAEAWSRFAVGSGLLMDGTPEATLLGQIELMHLPARFAESQPWLTSQAALLAAEASRRADRADEAAAIEQFIRPTNEKP